MFRQENRPHNSFFYMWKLLMGCRFYIRRYSMHRSSSFSLGYKIVCKPREPSTLCLQSSREYSIWNGSFGIMFMTCKPLVAITILINSNCRTQISSYMYGTLILWSFLEFRTCTKTTFERIAFTASFKLLIGWLLFCFVLICRQHHTEKELFQQGKGKRQVCLSNNSPQLNRVKHLYSETF